MNEQQTIQSLYDSLNNLRNALESDLTPNQIQWIDDVLDMIDVAYFKKAPDGSHQDWFYKNLLIGRLEWMTFEQAKKELLLRIYNTLNPMF